MNRNLHCCTSKLISRRIQAKYGPSAKLPEIDLAVMGSELADQGDFDGAAELHRISTELYHRAA